ncbi:MAG TPA: UDP-N-acetylglucosamine 2-epimerase (non-hydrolyzing) [Anaerolineales bacterium]|nr:UDP-N-acetylglucosamine 2-epimerase (non-hydrolyzing) [Anaerolineales bacterium]HNQ95239.1 UDP-N-acetylglucosamine 2-epimerase (non-hydrolyzing) [Anaerolineales bacterium]HNS61414.1 UDP-N-acetylglucosamine 2-epimerase (non-hydrolyzing) [Anaerolineales bacterium]
MKTIVSIVGARPQFIKAAPVSRALTSHFNEVMIHTGQHYDYEMSDLFFKEMDMRQPDFNLGIGGGTHGAQTGMMLIELEKVMSSVKPDCILVYGDTNSTLAGALTAAKAGTPLAHVEAGLRSYNRAMPEEVNRVLTDHVSTWLFCPTDVAVQNLKKEGIVKGVHQIGDVMYDALLHNLEIAREKSQILARMSLKKGEYALATVHRAGNTDNRNNMQSILDALGSLPTRVIFPVHPRTRKRIEEWELAVNSNVSLIEPLGPLDILQLLENANCILTDSGGMQREAYLLGARCITLREETEWVETVSAGWNSLAGVDAKRIRALYETWKPAGERPLLYGDGRAAEKIVQILVSEII